MWASLHKVSYSLAGIALVYNYMKHQDYSKCSSKDLVKSNIFHFSLHGNTLGNLALLSFYHLSV